MRPVIELRKIEVKRDEKWVSVRMAEIKKGETFRYEEDGKLNEWVAASDGKWCTADNNITLQAMVLKHNVIIEVEPK